MPAPPKRPASEKPSAVKIAKFQRIVLDQPQTPEPSLDLNSPPEPQTPEPSLDLNSPPEPQEEPSLTMQSVANFYSDIFFFLRTSAFLEPAVEALKPLRPDRPPKGLTENAEYLGNAVSKARKCPKCKAALLKEKWIDFKKNTGFYRFVCMCGFLSVLKVVTKK
jgi:hypothetical protein